MKTEIYVVDGITQLVITPETEFDKVNDKLLSARSMRVEPVSYGSLPVTIKA